MNWCKALCALSIAVYGSACLAQDITDVEAKPYGSYTGGAIDTVDLATGNLMLNIPLISFPQRGALPPLTFSVELNNAPYAQTGWACGGDDCQALTSRYDTSPPGGVYQYPSTSDQAEPVVVDLLPGTCQYGPCTETELWGYEDGSIPTMGAYLTSSYEGGIVTGQVTYAQTDANGTLNAYIQYSLVDPSGTTHQLESDASNPPLSWNTYRAIDGSGYTFIPSGTPRSTPVGTGNAYNYWDPTNYGEGSIPDPIQVGTMSVNPINYWISNANPNPSTVTGGVRLGTLYSPTGIQYTDAIVSYSMTPTNTSQASETTPINESLVPRALISTAQDPIGNTIIRGPWYWSGYWSAPVSTTVPGSPITDIATIYTENATPFLSSSYHGPYYKDSVGRIIPDVIAMQATQYEMSGGWEAPTLSWTVPGPENNPVTYQINYTMISNQLISPPQQGELTVTPPDPSTNLEVSGLGIASIYLPSQTPSNQTSWQFQYYPYLLNASTAPAHDVSVLPGEWDAPGDLETVTTPSGGTITYTYTTIPYESPIMFSRCNSVCHAVQSRTETDGRGNSWKTIYSYSTPLPADLPATVCKPVNAGGVNVVYDFTTTETDPLGNDTVHSFCAVGSMNGVMPVANQYHEVETQYYQGPVSGGKLLKTVQTTQYDYQNDLNPPVNSPSGSIPGIVNVLPVQTKTTTPAGTATTVMQYSNDINQSTTNGIGQALFTASKLTCSDSDLTCASPSLGIALTMQGSISGKTVIPISYLSPTTETILDYYGDLLRSTSTTYLFQPPPSSLPSNCPAPASANNYQGANIVSLPLSVQESGAIWQFANGSGTTCYGYDEANGSPQGAFGNQTSKTETYNLSGSDPDLGTSSETQIVYNIQGMPISRIDGNRNVTTITYDPATNYLFPHSIQRPTTIPFQHIDYYSYDLNTGNLNWHSDENGSAPVGGNPDPIHTTTYQYDNMGRVTSISYPDGGGSSICYTDTGGSCPEAQAAIPPQASVPYSLYTNTTTGTTTYPILTMHNYDGWGRQYRSSVLNDLQGATFVDTTYDWEGRVASISNPYRNTPDGFTTSYTYDALGRKTTQTQPDGNTQQWCYDGIATNGPTNCPKLYTSNGFTPVTWTDVFDETGRHTQQVFDALGHLGTVTEPDPVSGHLALETDYAYDFYGDLLTVNQNGASGSSPVQRQFNYDMPSRVSWACNPEALGQGQNCNSYNASGGSVGTSYFYDGNSNLIQKIDNRSITTNYSYDALNRLLSKTYSNDPSGTASSCYQYDGAKTSNLSGRLVAQWTQEGACLSSSSVQTKTTILAYDAMGRLRSEQRCMGIPNCANSSSNYAMNYKYDLTGKLLTYPSGYGNLNFTNSYDGAGRLSSITGPSLLFSVPSYTPAGALSGAQLGASIKMSRSFDSRQRVLSETDSVIP
jgi:YD repeat-containing protein